MMTTSNLTIVEWYHVVDCQSPRTQSADTQPLLLDCSRRPDTMVRHSNSGFDERIVENTAYDCPPTSIQTRVPWTQQKYVLRRLLHSPVFPRTLLNIGHNNLAKLTDSLRLYNKVYPAVPRYGHLTSKTSVSCFSPADWLISSHVTLIVAGIAPMVAMIAV